MKKLLCCAISLIATSVSVAQPPPGPPPASVVDQAITEYRVVGFTDPTDGSVENIALSLTGVAAMHSLCAAVAPNARAAFTDEARRSPTPVAAPSQAWILATQPNARFHPDEGDDTMDWVAVDHASGNVLSFRSASAEIVIARSECNGFTSASLARIGLLWNTPSGTYVGAICDSLFPIACSAPVEVPISP